MTYTPHTELQVQEMLATIGVSSTDALFEVIPAQHRFPSVELPPALSEPELVAEMRAMAERNADLVHTPCFLGTGAYHHFVPSLVDHIISRSELYTAYTPYQPEVSQGTLQAIFEYQTMICALTQMDACNASHYDGATALAEAIITALTATRGKRRRVVMAPWVNPEYRQVCQTYVSGMDVELVTADDPTASIEQLVALLDDQTACLIVQTPDFVGRIHDLAGLAQTVHAHGALLIVVTNPIALGLLKPPGAYGADIALGDGQPLGSALSFGGPHLGFFACTQALVRRMSGRLVGETVDDAGVRGYVLTLSTREQHIRRDKASSNICTNQGLNALAAAVYLAAMGKSGLAHIARLCYHKAHHAAALIDALPGYAVDTRQPFFHEFVVDCPRPADEIQKALYEQQGIIGGYPLGRAYPDMTNRMLICVTEMNTAQQIERLVRALQEVA